MMRMTREWIVWGAGALAVAGAMAPTSVGRAPNWEGLTRPGLFPNTVVGQGVIASYYGRPATKSYFQGCSTGGRMGMMEAQRYPDDYDGGGGGGPAPRLLPPAS